MWARGGKVAITIGAALVTLVAAAPPAGAKGLPIASVSVSTATPTVRKPFTVTVRFEPGQDFGDYPWEDVEVSVLPAALTDAQGWPVASLDGRGKYIPIHRVGFGVFRGTAVVRHPGDFVIVDWSAVVIRHDRAQGIVNVGPNDATPVRLHVVRAAGASTAWWWIVGGIGVGLALGLLTVTRRRRVATAAEERAAPVYAGR